ncbi:MAG: CPBP family intramembrane metalloprotease [Rickettsiaceae bacterium]
MDLSYGLLALTALICLFTKARKLMFLSMVITVFTALFQEIISLSGMFSASCFLAICYAYFNYQNLNKFIKATLYGLIWVLLIGFAFHILPGFSNVLIVDKLSLSELSCPFSMYLNFDKSIAALILYITSGLAISEKVISKKAILQTILALILCIGVILVPGLISGYIALDIKVPDILLIWIVNNLLFVCMSEEVIFRGFLQESLKSFFVKKVSIDYLHIIVASVVFALAHFKGGAPFMILTLIAGVFYGYVYEKTGRIFCAMLVHFGLNLTHLIFFTYPASVCMTRMA